MAFFLFLRIDDHLEKTEGRGSEMESPEKGRNSPGETGKLNQNHLLGEKEKESTLFKKRLIRTSRHH
jgi:hypothetical protein